MIQNIKFRKVKCPFQQNIKNSNDLLVPTGKTFDFYKMDSNITKTYKKVKPNTMNSVELKAKEIAKKLHQEDRVNTTGKQEAFITL